MNKSQTLVDRFYSRIKNNPALASLIILGAIVIGLSTFTDATKKTFWALYLRTSDLILTASGMLKSLMIGIMRSILKYLPLRVTVTRCLEPLHFLDLSGEF
jgi:uncharacterized protein (DUF983 family)